VKLSKGIKAEHINLDPQLIVGDTVTIKFSDRPALGIYEVIVLKCQTL